VLDRIDTDGERSKEVAADIGVAWQTIAAWRRHLRPGTSKASARKPRDKTDRRVADLVRALLHAADCDADCERCRDYLRWAEETHAGVTPEALHTELSEHVQAAAADVLGAINSAREFLAPGKMAKVEAALRSLSSVTGVPLLPPSGLDRRGDKIGEAAIEAEFEALGARRELGRGPIVRS